MLRNLTFNTIYLAPKINMSFKPKAKFLVFVVLILLLSGFSRDPIQKKTIRTKEYDIHFYVTLKKRKTTADKEYFWYKAGEIHHSFGGASGELLHSEYTKYFAGNKLAEKGTYEYGLKTGIWKKWHPNGALMEETRWVEGEKYGAYHFYDDHGKLIITGKYRNNIKSDVWIDLKASDTTWYRQGVAYKEHPKIIKKRMDSISGKESFFKRVFGKKDSTAVKSNKSFFKRLFEKKENSEKQEKKSAKINKESDKPTFFQKLFGTKKEKEKKQKNK